MSSLFRPTYTMYYDAAGQRVPAGTPGARKVTGRSPIWHGRWRDRSGRTCTRKLHQNKTIAQKMLDQIDAEVVGLIERSREPLEPILCEYDAYLRARGGGDEHVSQTLAQCRAICHGAQFRTPADISEAKVVTFLGSLRQAPQVQVPEQSVFTAAELAQLFGVTVAAILKRAERGDLQAEPSGPGQRKQFARVAVVAFNSKLRGVSIETTNHYLMAFKGFVTWCKRNRILAHNPLEGADKLNAAADRRRLRRAASPETLSRLLEAATVGPVVFGLSGPDRTLLYLTAINTGFRAGELASLTPLWFDFSATPPTVKVRANYSKRKREDTQVLRQDVAQALRAYVANRKPDQPLWPGSWETNAAEMLRVDLEAAGIPYIDERGRVLDFHALRKSFITALVVGGVSAKVVQLLARHSSIQLTMETYTDASHLDLGSALDALPKLPLPRPPEAS